MKTNKLVLGATLLFVAFALSGVAYAQTDSIDSEVLLLYEKVDKPIARFAIFSNFSGDFYAYYQTKEERDSNKPLENYVWLHLVSTNDWPQGDFYDLLKTKNTRNRIFYSVNGFDVMPSTEYYYEIRDRSKSVITTGTFVSKPPFDRSTLGYSVLKDYLEIDYLKDQNEQASKNAGFFATLRAKYQDKRIYQSTKTIVNVTFYNQATGIALVAQHGLQGFWPDLYFSTGPYLTKEEYNCFFINGENPVTVTIKTRQDVAIDNNTQDNSFTKILVVNDAEEVTKENCSIDGKIYSAKMRVEWNGKDQNKPIEFTDKQPIQDSGKITNLPETVNPTLNNTTPSANGDYKLELTTGATASVKLETTGLNNETTLTEKLSELSVNSAETQNEVKVMTREEIKVDNRKLYVNDKEVKIMPSTASETALNALRLEKDISIQLKDTGKPVYEVSGTKRVKLFALFGINMNVKILVNAESGNIEKIEKPWWSFLSK